MMVMSSRQPRKKMDCVLYDFLVSLQSLFSGLFDGVTIGVNSQFYLTGND